MLDRTVLGFFLSLVIAALGSEQILVLGNGVLCSPTRICNPTQLLTCRNGYCQCAIPQDMINVFEESR